METAVIDQNEIKQEGSRALTFAQQYEITNDESLLEADRYFNLYAEKERERFLKFDPFRASAYATYQKALALVKEATEPFKMGKAIFEQKILTYRAKLKKAREEEEARLKKIAEAEAEEAKRKETEELLRQAAAIEQSGDADQAREIVEHALKVEAAPIKVAPPTAAPLPKLNSGFRDYWYAEVPDLMVLVKAVAAGRVPLAALKADMVYLNGRAKLEEGAMKIEGVIAKSEDGMIKERSKAAF